MNHREKPSILKARLADIIGDIADLEANTKDDFDLDLLAKLRTERDAIRIHLFRIRHMEKSA